MDTVSIAGLPPTHPGEMLREDVLPATGHTKSEIARMLGISRQHLHDILQEKKPITPQMALRFAKLMGGSPDVWLRMQMAYDLKIEAPRMAEALAHIPTLEAA